MSHSRFCCFSVLFGCLVWFDFLLVCFLHVVVVLIWCSYLSWHRRPCTWAISPAPYSEMRCQLVVNKGISQVLRRVSVCGSVLRLWKEAIITVACIWSVLFSQMDVSPSTWWFSGVQRHEFLSYCGTILEEMWKTPLFTSDGALMTD